MKKNEVKALKEKTLEALEQDLQARRKQLFDLRTQSVIQKIESTALLGKTRRDIARLLTVINDKKKSAAATTTA